MDNIVIGQVYMKNKGDVLDKNYPLKTVDEAVTSIKNGKGLIYNVDDNDDEATINSVDFVLWSDPNGMEQQYGVPQYVFSGKTKNGNDLKIITCAISDEYIIENK